MRVTESLAYARWPDRQRPACKNHSDRPVASKGLCRSCYQQKWNQENRDVAHRADIKFRYGLTPAEYDNLLSISEGKCMICRQPNKRRRLAVDHDHATGKVRGLLCDRCNMALGVVDTYRTEIDNYLRVTH